MALLERNRTYESSTVKYVDEWRNMVQLAVLKKNGKKLLENCQTSGESGKKIHTKTKHIYEALTNDVY